MQTISLASDQIGPALIPAEELADCAESVLRRDGKTILSYGPGAGYAPLREWIGEGDGVHPPRGVLANGRPHALSLLASRARGRGVIAEYPIHDRAERVLLDAGASLLATPIDEHGLVTDQLQPTPRMNVMPAMVYVIPSFHNPTGWSTSAEGRRRIVELVISQNLLQTDQIRLVEDDSYGQT